MFRSLLLLAFLVPSALPQADLQDASLEQLMQIHVRSVSKKDQKLSRVAAAVFVLTPEDIRRSGATSIPDLLRLVPGVQVARLDSSTWAISIRGFNARYSNKVLVLIDGRTAYDVGFSGVFWDHQDVPLEDIASIEVIRGPGGSVWGANAVNGVISITTKTAWQTQGGLISATAGTLDHGRGLFQFGGKLGAKSAYRAYARFAAIGDSKLPAGVSDDDAWAGVRGGFRGDWDLSRRDSLTLQGDVFHNSGGHKVSTSFLGAGPAQGAAWWRIGVSSGNILARWGRTLSETSDLQLQLYGDRFTRDDVGVLESVSVFDVDFQHRFALGRHHDVVWGLGYRTNNTGGHGYGRSVSVPYRTDLLPSAFFQDEISLTKSAWLTIGARIEHNAYTGVEYEPSVRLAWTPTRHQTIWASASRAIRQPSRSETGVIADLGKLPLAGGLLAQLRLMGNPALLAEDFRDYELGYRVQVRPELSLDVAAFGGLYHHLQLTKPGQPIPVRDQGPIGLLIPVQYRNAQHARTYGGEFFATYDVTRRWRLSPGYAYTVLSVLSDDALPVMRGTPQNGGIPPKHSLQIRSLLNLPRNIEFDTTLYRVGALPAEGIAGYTQLDARIGWRLNESTELSFAGQNLLRPTHLEINEVAVMPALVNRNVCGKITWHF